MTPEQKAFLEALETLKKAIENVRDAWENDIASDVGSDEYPFEESFDEYPLRMGAWIEAVQSDFTPKKTTR